jgi:hypothetical protein
MALFVAFFKTDHFVVPFFILVSALFLFTWITTYTTLRSGILRKRIFLFSYRCFAVGDIESVRPHRKNGRWSYGTVIEVWSEAGKKLTLQANHPVAFLALLRQQAPQAKFLVL